MCRWPTLLMHSEKYSILQQNSKWLKAKIVCFFVMSIRAESLQEMLSHCCIWRWSSYRDCDHGLDNWSDWCGFLVWILSCVSRLSYRFYLMLQCKYFFSTVWIICCFFRSKAWVAYFQCELSCESPGVSSGLKEKLWHFKSKTNEKCKLKPKVKISDEFNSHFNLIKSGRQLQYTIMI